MTFTELKPRITFVLTALIALLLAGCSGPPQTISLDIAFYEHPLEIAAFADARDQWCEKTGWCPEFVTDGEARFERKSIGQEGFPAGAIRAGHTDNEWSYDLGYNSHVALDGDALDEQPEMAWWVIAHELGHVRGEHHNPVYGCTMYWKQDGPVFELTCEQ